MRLTRFLVALSVLVAVCPASYAGSIVYQGGEGSPSTETLQSKAQHSNVGEKKENRANEGAVPEFTVAEKTKKSEEVFEQQLVGLAREILSMETRIADLRKRADAPPQWEVERVEKDLSLLDQELTKVPITTSSPLAQLQRSRLQDQLFEAQLSLEISKGHWGGNWMVFGLDFFNTAPPSASAEQRPVPDDYKLRIGDKLRLLVISNLGQQTEYFPVIDTGGRILVPGAGAVRANGMTCYQLQSLLTKKISTRFKQLEVSASVESLSTIQIQVNGDVARPATYTMSGMVTVLSALYQAGGPTKSGSFRRVKLVRDGEPDRVVDLYDFLLGGSRKQDLPLKDGDLVFVPPVGQTIVVSGDVVRPSRYEPTFPLNLGAALKMAGGVKATGYLQTVQLERVMNNEYTVLLSEPVNSESGDSSFMLKPGDLVNVMSVRPDRTNQVSINGPLRAPGDYGYFDGMKVSELIKLAQGFDQSKEVYGGRADILRTDPLKGSEIITINLDLARKGDPAGDVALSKLDRVFIYEPDQVVFRPRLVTVLGSVSKPGTYRRTEGMRVSDLMAAAGGTLPDAYLDRADVLRQLGDNATELVRISLQAALSGDTASNVMLQDRDEITIHNVGEVKWSDKTVRIEGAVQRQGVYARPENMRVSDLLFACGGLLPEASKTIEVGRVSDSGTNEIVSVDAQSLVPSSTEDIQLLDRDVVTVPSVNPSLRSPEVVFIIGEVARPGPYTIGNRNEKLADIIARAGGTTQYADLPGMLFLRQKEGFENNQQGKDVDLILQKSRIFADKQFLVLLAKMGAALPGQFTQTAQQPSESLAKPTEVVAEERLKQDTSKVSYETDVLTSTNKERADNEELRKALAQKASVSDLNTSDLNKGSAMGPRLKSFDTIDMSGFEGRKELADLAKSARVSVNLKRAFEEPSSPDNIVLRDGDRVYIPRITNVVTVVGAVFGPHAFAAGSGKNVDYYIQRSGGYAQDAAKANVVVVRSNGDALPKDQVASVEPGDMIVVPSTGLVDIVKKSERVGSVAKLISDVLSSAFILTRF